jgi:toxin ParE1/3/4
MSSFRVSERARNDLAEIHAYISRDKPVAATRFVDGFFDLFKLLATNSGLGQDRGELRVGLRSISHGNYVVFFYPATGGDGVEIVSILHGARDIDRMFQSGER